MFNLTGRFALVTGASGGIGNSIAKALTDAGAKVALSGTRVEALEKTAAEIGGSPVILPCNLADPVATSALVGQAEEALGGLDILVFNAGLTKDGLLMRMKDEDWDTVLNVNLGAYFRLTKAAMRGMMKRRHGRIIGITSVVERDGKCRADQLCRIQGRHDRVLQVAGPGSGQPEHYGELHRPRLHCHSDDGCPERRTERSASQGDSSGKIGDGG